MPRTDRRAREGDRILHPDLGPGRVLGLLRGGRVVRVEFDEMPKVPWEVPQEDLRVHEISPKMPPRGKKTKKRRRKPAILPPFPEELGDADSRSARQALEALRLGVVPCSHLETYTVGRDAELALVRRDLEQVHRRGGFRVVLGDYGTGKTHFLEMAERLALGQGFLAARATLDSREVLPSRPRRIFHQLARGLRYPDDPPFEPRGLRPLIEKAAADHELVKRWSGRNRIDHHPYLGPVLAYHAALSEADGPKDLDECLLDWIEGSEVASNMDLDKRLRRATGTRARMYALLDHRTVTHLYTLVLGGIAELARQVGYKGLAVMVDEAEFYSVLRGKDRAFAEVLFRTFAAACLPRPRLRFDPGILPRGGHAVHRSFSYRFRSPQPLYCIFALTYDPEGKEVLTTSVAPECFMELRHFRPEEYVTLAERVLVLYRIAGVDLSLGPELAKLMARVIEPCHRRGLIENPRQAHKFITELVDLTRHRPDSIRPVLADIEKQLKKA